MPTLKESDAPSVVFIGQFSPAAFQPSWLATKELIKESEATEAKVVVISPEFTDFSISWVHIQVTTQRCFLRALDSSHDNNLLDLAIGVCAHLSPAPPKMMGVNREVRFRMSSVDDWHALGDRLAPKEPWEATGLIAWPIAGRNLPGLRSLTVEGRRANSKAVGVRITIGPTPANEPQIVVIQTNEHFESSMDGMKKLENESLSLAQILADSWNESQEFAKAAALALVEETR